MSEERKVGEAPSEAAEASSPAKTIQRVQLSQLGAQLPIGILAPDGTLNKSLATRPWKTKDEREIGKQKVRSTADRVPNILSRLVTQIGPHSWTDEEPSNAEKRVTLAQMYMGDVFYAYVWIRREAMGSVLALKDLICFNCEHKFDYAADLDTLEVRTVGEESMLDWSYQLRHPFQLRGKMVEKFQMGALRWGMVDTVATDNEAAGKIGAVRGAIKGLNDDEEPVMLTEQELDELSKRDLETITEAINQNFVGPDMAVEGKCPKCHVEFMRPIDWRAESFFAVSSQ